ncbi:L,D-transpeptidase family protein [Aestuariivirga sp.]|uniref:L,D-transpeptidase family protein n=1 Tax=Aestuariivirga sp. TaxID=2650926 RepID=UPI00391C0A5B
MPAILFLALMIVMLLPQGALAAELSPDAVENAQSFEQGEANTIDPAMIRLQVLLDRSRFSPGVIDGLAGENVSKAISAYEQANGLEADGKPDEKLLAQLAGEGGEPVLTRYTIKEEDVSGPFLDSVPEKLEDMAKLDALSYTSPRELLAEKFHMDEDLLEALNPGADFSKAGTEITVARVSSREEKETVTRIDVDKSLGGLFAYDDQDELVAFYPATIGSSDMPSPTGTHEVRTIAPEPTYYYDPKKLNFSGVKADGLLEIAAGPNNPVGTVWIDLTEPTYGIHGTPEPSLIAKTQSHGCVRLTNWDAEELSKMVKKGTSVAFKD